MPASVGPIDPAVCPVYVDRPVMRHRWELLTFVHWRYDAASIQALLPDGLTVETFDGSAWVGLVPFYMRVSAPVGPSVPWASQFCETNVRTYVRDAFGHSGIWFLSLDAARLGAVLAARATYQLPYFWSRMRLDVSNDVVSYSCARRWPGPGASSRLVVRLGDRYAADELGALDHFLTARWIVFSVIAGRLTYARAFHPPWPLRRASLDGLDDGLVSAAGLDPPAGTPLLHYSPGVSVRIGLPKPVSAR
jgi:uncharacterized protein YqjF (DUF2071 family)